MKNSHSGGVRYHYADGYRVKFTATHKFLFFLLYGFGFFLICAIISLTALTTYDFVSDYTEKSAQATPLPAEEVIAQTPYTLFHSASFMSPNVPTAPLVKKQPAPVPPPNDSLYIIGGNNGQVQYSHDLTVWAKTNTGLSHQIIDIASGYGRFVAIDRTGEIAISTNGDLWDYIGKPTLFSDTLIERLAWNGQQFVALAQNGQVAISPNGQNWYPASKRDLSAIEQETAPDQLKEKHQNLKLIANGYQNTMLQIYQPNSGKLLEEIAFNDGAYYAISVRN